MGLLAENGTKFRKSIKAMIDEKMKVLDDFGICDRHDKEMREKLRKAVENKPDKDPRETLDYACRPLIHAKVNSWT